MTRMKALLAGTALAAATALSAVAVTAAPAGNGPAGAEAAKGPAHHGFHKARGEGHGWGPHHRGGARGDDFCKRAGGHMERRAEMIEGLMTFTPEQQTAWNDLKATMKSTRETMQKDCEARKDAEKPKTAVERFNRIEDTMSKRLEAMRAVKPKFEAFYATLSEKQQKAFDGLFTRRGRHG